MCVKMISFSKNFWIIKNFYYLCRKIINMKFFFYTLSFLLLLYICVVVLLGFFYGSFGNGSHFQGGV